MIPVEPLSPLLLLIYLAPFIGVLGGLYLIVWYWVKRPVRLKQHPFTCLLMVVVLACIGIMVWLALLFFVLEPARMERVEGRRNFVLSESLQHGTAVFPAGTQIYRVDNFDGGDPDYPQRLTESFVARFAEPIVLAGTKVSAVDLSIAIYPRVLLAESLQIDGITCLAGQSVQFDNIQGWRDYERDRNGKAVPRAEGAQADFDPASWAFMSCDMPDEQDFRLSSRFR